jgi:hypothetical protein
MRELREHLLQRTGELKPNTGTPPDGNGKLYSRSPTGKPPAISTTVTGSSTSSSSVTSSSSSGTSSGTSTPTTGSSSGGSPSATLSRARSSDPHVRSPLTTSKTTNEASPPGGPMVHDQSRASGGIAAELAASDHQHRPSTSSTSNRVASLEASVEPDYLQRVDRFCYQLKQILDELSVPSSAPVQRRAHMTYEEKAQSQLESAIIHDHFSSPAKRLQLAEANAAAAAAAATSVSSNNNSASSPMSHSESTDSLFGSHQLGSGAIGMLRPASPQPGLITSSSMSNLPSGVANNNNNGSGEGVPWRGGAPVRPLVPSSHSRAKSSGIGALATPVTTSTSGSGGGTTTTILTTTSGNNSTGNAATSTVGETGNGEKPSSFFDKLRNRVRGSATLPAPEKRGTIRDGSPTGTGAIRPSSGSGSNTPTSSIASPSSTSSLSATGNTMVPTTTTTTGGQSTSGESDEFRDFKEATMEVQMRLHTLVRDKDRQLTLLSEENRSLNDQLRACKQLVADLQQEQQQREWEHEVNREFERLKGHNDSLERNNHSLIKLVGQLKAELASYQQGATNYNNNNNIGGNMNNGNGNSASTVSRSTSFTQGLLTSAPRSSTFLSSSTPSSSVSTTATTPSSGSHLGVIDSTTPTATSSPQSLTTSSPSIISGESSSTPTATTTTTIPATGTTRPSQSTEMSGQVTSNTLSSLPAVPILATDLSFSTTGSSSSANGGVTATSSISSLLSMLPPPSAAESFTLLQSSLSPLPPSLINTRSGSLSNTSNASGSGSGSGSTVTSPVSPTLTLQLSGDIASP